jgi:rubredoxin
MSPPASPPAAATSAPPRAAPAGPTAAAAVAEGTNAKKGFKSISSNVTRGRMAAPAPPCLLLLAAEPALVSLSTPLATVSAAAENVEEAAEAREPAESCRWMEEEDGSVVEALAPGASEAALPMRWSTPVCACVRARVCVWSIAC